MLSTGYSSQNASKPIFIIKAVTGTAMLNAPIFKSKKQAATEAANEYLFSKDLKPN